MPGRSTISTMSAPSRTLVASRSTVIPGQLPTRADAPVTRLKNVDLPVFGMPTSAMRFIAAPASTRDDDLPGLATTKDEVGGAEADVQRPGEPGLAHHPDALPDAHAERGKAAPQRGVGVDGGDRGVVARGKLVQRYHGRTQSRMIRIFLDSVAAGKTAA